MTSSGDRRYSQVGLDRVVRLRWLEKTARLVQAGNTRPSVRELLKEDLQEAFPSSIGDVRGSLDKTVTVLMKVWLTAPSNLESLRLRGLQFLSGLPTEDRIAVHYGMVMAAYPFWGAVALQVGRLLRLQETASLAQIQRRAKEQYGERETVARRARYVVRSFVDWQVLKESGTKGVYAAAPTMSIGDPALIAWLVEASLHARADRSASLSELLDNPSLFPFRLVRVGAEQLATHSPALDVVRHSLDQDLVTLRRMNSNDVGRVK